jgi:Na+-transporting NADH:ubiquinone oxidoreductase subunit NqrC
LNYDSKKSNCFFSCIVNNKKQFDPDFFFNPFIFFLIHLFFFSIFSYLIIKQDSIMKDVVYIVVLSIFAVVLIVLLYSTLSTRSIANKTNDLTKQILKNTSDSNDSVATDFLFFIGSDDKKTVSVTVNELDSRQISVTMPTGSSNFTAFTNVPLHESYDLGTLYGANAVFNGSRQNPVDTSTFTENEKFVIDGLINAQDQPFIDKIPNCTLSFTIQNTVNEYEIDHIDTIAKMTALKNNADNTTTISFIILDGNKLVPAQVYEYVSITVDNFFSDFLIFVGASIGTFALCAVAEVGTLGLATAACVGAVLGTAGLATSQIVS